MDACGTLKNVGGINCESPIFAHASSYTSVKIGTVDGILGTRRLPPPGCLDSRIRSLDDRTPRRRKS